MAENKLESCPLCRQAFATSDEETFEDTRQHAERGRPWACFELGLIYASGAGFAKSHKLAYEWYRRGAELGSIRASHWLGQCHRTGRGAKQSYSLAWKWYGKALKAGYALTQYH